MSQKIETLLGGAFTFQKYIHETFMLSKYDATKIVKASWNIRKNAASEIIPNHVYLYGYEGYI